jgi:hypothetical protein
MKKANDDNQLIKFNIYIERRLLEQLKANATQERRSVSATINLACELYLKLYTNDKLGDL